MKTLDSAAAVAPRISGYATTRRLGEGGSSTVWLVTRNSDGMRFALKCVGGDAASDGRPLERRRALEQVSREVGNRSGLNHAHVVGVHEVLPLEGASGGVLAIIMDYAAGGSLANLMSGRARLRVGEAVTILTPLAQALDYLHANGAVHGDVSPGNVLFTAEGMPLLADFGIASRVGDGQRNLDMGTPGFFDPACTAASFEVGSAGEELQPQRDIYSLAAVGWYCLTGKAPEQALDRPPLSLLVPDVPKNLAAALEAALDPDPRARPSAREFGTAIFRSAAPEPLDLSGSVHPSVIPELLTRRQTLQRSPRRVSHWLMWSQRVLPWQSPARPRQQSRVRRQQGRPLQRVGVRAVLLVATGVLIASVSWAAWQQSQPAPSPSQSAMTSSRPATTGQATDLPQSAGIPTTTDIPKELEEELRSEDPAVVVPALSALRDIALGQGRLELLSLVNASGSPAEAADKELGDHLRDAGTMFAGLQTTVSGIAVKASPQADHVLAGVTVTTSAYEERQRSGAVVRRQDAGTPQDLRLHMVRLDGRWWISEILGPSDAG